MDRDVPGLELYIDGEAFVDDGGVNRIEQDILIPL